jgi:hypothetical protein
VRTHQRRSRCACGRRRWLLRSRRAGCRPSGQADRMALSCCIFATSLASPLVMSLARARVDHDLCLSTEAGQFCSDLVGIRVAELNVQGECLLPVVTGLLVLARLLEAFGEVAVDAGLLVRISSVGG